MAFVVPRGTWLLGRSRSDRMLSQGMLRSTREISNSSELAMGIDFGTSGARSTVITREGEVIEEHKRDFDTTKNHPEAHLEAWQSALHGLLGDVSSDLRQQISSLAIDGTSATAMLADGTTGIIVDGPLLYNEGAPDHLKEVERIAPIGHTVRSATSTLCKLVSWYRNGSFTKCSEPVLLHQVDWLVWLLTGEMGISDHNNALKLGFDPALAEDRGDFPDWLRKNERIASALPRKVLEPGEPLACVRHDICQKYALRNDVVVCAGTTDSNAAFVAAGIDESGGAVTSLGSTMAIKLISNRRVEDSDFGVYSHKMFGKWLVGGASNVGGFVLRQHFRDEELPELSQQIDPDRPSQLNYYPLPSTGERFPINDPSKEPVLEPRPESKVEFLKGILEGIAQVEKLAFEKLREMDATPVRRVVTSGGGSGNEQWRRIRERVLGVPVSSAERTEASYGAALLASRGCSHL